MTRYGGALVLCLVLVVVACSAPEPAPEVDAMPEATTDHGAGSILRVDPRLDALVPADARIEKLADGFTFTEGPVWRRSDSRLFFSDVRDNTLY